MPNDLTISFIGGGTMAEAILAAVLGKGLVDSSAIVVGEPIAQRREYLSDNYGVQTTPDNLKAIEGAQMVVLAVKPQLLDDVMAELQGRIAPPRPCSP